MTDSTSWHELFANLPIFKDAIITGGLAGALLGFIGVHVVLRRMVFASSAIAQAAALGVALSFWMPIVIDPVRHAAGHQAGRDVHLVSSLLFEPVLWAIGGVAAGDAGLHRQPGAAAPDAREPARPRLPGQRRGRRHRRRSHHAGGARSVGDPVRQRGGRAAGRSGAGDRRRRWCCWADTCCAGAR